MMRSALLLVIAAGLATLAPSAYAQPGWAVGDGSAIVHTTDGITWSPQSSPVTPAHFFGVSFVDANNGWAVGINEITSVGLIIHTTNGGVTWTQQTDPNPDHDSLNAVDFVDLNNGWAVGSDNSKNTGEILHTSNGGATWSLQGVGVTPNVLTGVSFVDANNGWAVGIAATIMHTSDGGTTWLPQIDPAPGHDLNGVSFVDANNGWAVGQTGTILHTSNGGATWSVQTDPDPATNDLLGVFFVDANNGWAVGTGGIILHTTNGGTTWTIQTSPVPLFLFGVGAADASNAWIVGEAGTLLHTTNGGATWVPEVSNAPADLQSVSIVRAAAAAAAGAPATLDVPFQVKIFPNLTSGDSVINIGNTGTTGNLCVNVYVFSPDEQEVACCTCFVTPNGVVTTSARQLISKTLTPAVPTAITVKLIATAGGGCNASTPGTIAPGLIAFGTNLHAATVGGSITTGTFATTETPFRPATLSAAELSRISTLCGFILSNGTGFGVCPGCATGAAGAARQ